MYTDFVKNVTISLPDAVWARLREEAADARMSLNAYVRRQLSGPVQSHENSVGVRIARLARELGPSSVPTKFDRNAMYEELL